MKTTLPALMFSLLKLSYQIEAQALGQQEEWQQPETSEEDQLQLIKVDQTKIFKNVNELILALQEFQPEQCLKLYLQGAQAINNI